MFGYIFLKLFFVLENENKEDMEHIYDSLCFFIMKNISNTKTQFSGNKKIYREQHFKILLSLFLKTETKDIIFFSK